MSLARAIRRRHITKLPGDLRPEPRTQPVISDERGYRTLRPTKGWIRISLKRVQAGHAIGRMYDIGGMVAASRRSEPKPSKVYHAPTGPIPEGRVTRQQIRWAARRGIDLTPAPAPAAAVKPKRVRKPKAVAA